MNITHLKRAVSVRFFAAITIASLLISAFPAGFFVAQAASNVFVDGFEPSTNLGNWTAAAGWSSASDQKNAGTKSAKLVGANGSQVLSKTISTVGYQNLTVSFWFRTDDLDDDEKVEVDYTTNGSTWTEFNQIDEDDEEKKWKFVTFNLPAAANNNASFALRFDGELENGSSKVWIDDVTITGDAIPPPPVPCEAPYTGTQPNCVPPPCEVGFTGTYPNCTPIPPPSCTDGIQNQDETGVDTGGICVPPPPQYCAKGYTGTPPNCVPVPPQCVNLLTNGSFETPEVTETSLWQKFASVTGWIIEKVTDSTPTTLELHKNWESNEAADGLQYAELDGDHSTKITQPVATIAGATYELSWAFAPRHDIAAEQNQLSVSVNGTQVATNGPATGIANIESTDWVNSTYNFTAAGTTTTITFADAGPSNSFGTLLDDAQLCLVKEPEPVATIVMTKIVCEDESLLPNDGLANVTPTTAAEFLASSEARTAGCTLAADASFQWALNGQDVLVDNEGAQGAPWVTTSSTNSNGITTVTIPQSQIGDGKTISVREVMDTSKFIPFAGRTNLPSVSAELYCTNDAANYDNLEWIGGVQVNNTYHCVAWNVPADTTSDVTLCKYDATEKPLKGWTLMLLGDKLDTLTVPANNPAGVNSVALTASTSYVAVAEGTWDNNRGPLNIVDAEYSTETAWTTIMDGFTTFPTDILELFINNIADPLSNWGAYNSNHKYAQAFVQGTNAPANFSINDTFYGDNTGSLTVNLYEGYAGITGDNGCVTFKDVPFAEYTVDEVQQDGWQNLSGLGAVVVDAVTEIFSVVNRDVSRIPVATVHAYKLVCTDEADLPNGNVPATITASTAAEWIAEHDSCALTPGVGFEWAGAGTVNPDAQLPTTPLYGYAGGAWTSLGTTNSQGYVSIALTAAQIGDGSHVWMREALPNGYIPFTYGPGNQSNSNDVTAEMYCHTDGVNYDNYERIDGIAVENDYYCVAWNSPVPPVVEQCTIASSANTLVLDVNKYAVPTYTHNNWIASSTILGAEWIWETYYADESGDLDFDITKTFVETFNVATPTKATLDIAADNGYIVYINDTLVLDRSLPAYDNNFQAHTYKQGLDVSAFIVNGANELKVIVTNKGVLGSNSMNNPAGTLFKLTMEVLEDSVCEVTTAPLKEPAPKTVRLEGFKYSLDNESETSELLAGWPIYAKALGTTTVLSTTTDAKGYYYFDVPADGEWEVFEVFDATEWEQVWVEENGYTVYSEGSESLDYCYFDLDGYEWEARVSVFDSEEDEWSESEEGYNCSFYNRFIGEGEPETPVVEDEPRNSKSTGTRVTNRASAMPLVAGASTSVCPYLNDYMQMEIENDPWEVTKLQMFLKLIMGYDTPVTGIFDATTRDHVIRFQEAYRTDILEPWFKLGIVPHNNPTGFVYKLTKWKINDIVCPGSEAYPTFDGENLIENVVIN